MRRAGYLAVLLCLAPDARRAAATPAGEGRPWLGEELPLPLAVRTPQDLAVKAVAERQYLIFNLLAGGKLAWDGGDFATAATKWEALLRIRPLDAEIEKTIRPLAHEARARAGSATARGDRRRRRQRRPRPKPRRRQPRGRVRQRHRRGRGSAGPGRRRRVADPRRRRNAAPRRPRAAR